MIRLWPTRAFDTCGDSKDLLMRRLPRTSVSLPSKSSRRVGSDWAVLSPAVIHVADSKIKAGVFGGIPRFGSKPYINAVHMN